ncbi:hypothetical protein [Olleya sp. Bg11-27]|uniref:hypothetical protein n=1 Tax=Olleya sp. Bg11-27 TaxID=2058135 RepID=UPI000C30198A|nr:hypothetical protein [Olleya sp. Bg11-27]AUC74955.1 hypothetical protein CW732_04405 [Olleya sp. Bg11-27]
MNKIILTSILLFTFICKSSAQNDSIPQTIEQQKTAKNIAEKWATLLIKGENIDSLIAISKIPFALDRKKILNSKDELKAFYNKVIDNKGKRIMPKFSSEIVYSKYEIIEKCIPINVLIIKITPLEGHLKGEGGLVSVEISGNDMKIIGFSD